MQSPDSHFIPPRIAVWTRRAFLRHAVGAGIALTAFTPHSLYAQEPPPITEEDSLMLVDNPQGNFQFLKGFGPFSAGGVAHSGYEIVHATFHSPPPLSQGYELIERHLRRSKRPLNALCGMELRIPQPLSFPAFAEFNQPYVEQLTSWDLLVDGLVPVARSNVALAFNPVSKPSVHGFSYTVPSEYEGKTFVLSGVPEVQFREDGHYDIISAGDISTGGMRQKAEYVFQVVTASLQAMQVGWPEVTAIEIYTVHNIHPLLVTTILPGLQKANRQGICWHYARPPVVEVEYEMDVRGVRQELVLTE